MPSPPISIWKKAPFARLLLPMMAGILWQEWMRAPVFWWVLLFLLATTGFGCFFFLPFFKRYTWRALNGICIVLAFTATGAILLWNQDIRNKADWIGRIPGSGVPLAVTLQEPPVEKANSYRAVATADGRIDKGRLIKLTGRLILYFPKDSAFTLPADGSTLLIKKPPQEINSAKNPGGFDFKRYCLLQQITHQVYLAPGDFIVLKEKKKKGLPALIQSIRQKVLRIIRTYIKGDKEQGLAEALLIGYKEDLDKRLVRSYTNTGVVHIIAISGLHLGLIYGLLLLLTKPLQKKRLRRLKPLVVVTGLWLFTGVAGAQPSVLRSAVMFTCLVLGESLDKKSPVYNSLAVSAFLLLCYNPSWLWDIGFQLSYAAVLSIVIYRKPVYNWFYFKHKLPDLVWKMNAVTIAAQILTLPLTVYHFHQFPNFFLLTNFIAVPLSGVLVLGEIILCAFSFVYPLAILCGQLLSLLIGFMNSAIEWMEALPFSISNGLQISLAQAALLLLGIAGTSSWLMEKQRRGFFLGLVALGGFLLLRSLSFIEAENQQKIIVYYAPRQQAIDLVDGRHFIFIGDSSLATDSTEKNFRLQPTRTLYRTRASATGYSGNRDPGYISFADKQILWLSKAVNYRIPEKKEKLDLLILSKNPGVQPDRLARIFRIKQVVFDASMSPRIINDWKKTCDSLQIPWYDVSEKGAFVMNLR